MKFNLIAKLTLATSLLMSGHAFSITIDDVVFVDDRTTGPFCIQIFEASKKEAKKHGVSSSYNPGNKLKPDRMSYSEAKTFCNKVGMKVPTKAQWMAAASNLGRNRVSTLRNDADPSTANVKSGDSTSVNSVSKVKIDAVGTIGMTGNRGEWVDGGAQCGGSYQTRRASDLKLSASICRDSNFESGTATVRCVYEVSNASEVTVNLTGLAESEHVNYLNTINFGFSSNSSGQAPRVSGPRASQGNNGTTSSGTVNGNVYEQIVRKLQIDDDEEDFN